LQTGDGSDANLQTQIKEGKGNMPPFKSLLTDDQVWKLIAFVRSLIKGVRKKSAGDAEFHVPSSMFQLRTEKWQD